MKQQSFEMTFFLLLVGASLLGLAVAIFTLPFREYSPAPERSVEQILFAACREVLADSDRFDNDQPIVQGCWLVMEEVIRTETPE